MYGSEFGSWGREITLQDRVYLGWTNTLFVYLKAYNCDWHEILLQLPCLQLVILLLMTLFLCIHREVDYYVYTFLFYISIQCYLENICSWIQHCAASGFTTVNPLHFLFSSQFDLSGKVCRASLLSMCSALWKCVLVKKQNHSKQYGFPV